MSSYLSGHQSFKIFNINLKLLMKYSNSIFRFFSKVFSIVNLIKFYNENLKDQIVVKKIAKFISETKDTNILFVNELIDSLLVHKQKMNKSLDETS